MWLMSQHKNVMTGRKKPNSRSPPGPSEKGEETAADCQMIVIISSLINIRETKVVVHLIWFEMRNTPDGNQTCQDELHLEKVAFDLFIFKFLASYFNLNLKKHQILFRLLTATIQ